MDTWDIIDPNLVELRHASAESTRGIYAPRRSTEEVPDLWCITKQQQPENQIELSGLQAI